MIDTIPPCKHHRIVCSGTCIKEEQYFENIYFCSELHQINYTPSEKKRGDSHVNEFGLKLILPH